MLKTGLQWKVTIAVLVAVGLTSGVAQADAPLFPSGSASGSASDPDAGQDGLLPNPNGPTVDDVPDDPIGGVKRLKFKQDPQEEDQWCWSAASVSIADFHKKKISQDDFCRHVFGIDSATGKCPNRPANFGQVVHAFTEEGFDAKTVEKPFTLGQIKHEIDAGRPMRRALNGRIALQILRLVGVTRELFMVTMPTKTPSTSLIRGAHLLATRLRIMISI